jgi:2-dehydro-3-deoxygluconokinase
VSYARQGSAGSRLQPSDLDHLDFGAIRSVHVSGVTAALGEGPRHTALELLRRASAAGVATSCDLNYRAKLWSAKQAAPHLRALAEGADVVFGGEDEWQMVAGTSDVAGHDLARGRVLVVTAGVGEVTAVVEGKTLTQATYQTTVVDVVGAGDAFVGGVLAARLAGAQWPVALQQGVYCGARVVSALGDWANLPFGEAGLVALPGHGEEVAR